MKYLLVFVAIILTAAAVFTDDEKEYIKSEAKKCVESSGVDKEILKKAKARNVQDDPKFRDYIFCILNKLQIINETGDVIVSFERGKKWIPPSFTDDEKENIMNTCNRKKGSTPKETGFLIYKCYSEHFPANHKTLI